MSTDDRVILEAQRWFRTILRGANISLRPHEMALFTALAERQNARGNLFVAKDPDVERPALTMPGPGPEIMTTVRPPSTKMQRLIDQSKRPGETRK